MNLTDQIRRILLAAGFEVRSEERLGNNTGTAIRLTSGQIVNVFGKGTWHVQGRQPDQVKGVIDRALAGAARAPLGPLHRVFVVYGHDAAARTQLDAMLRRWGLEPLFLDQLPSEGQTVIEKLERYTAEVRFAVVLATPDDVGHRADRPDEKQFRVRQNVVLELGMMLALLGRSRVAILLKNPDEIERPSDIQGLIYIPFKDSVDDARLLLAKEMNVQGYQIDIGRL